MNARVLHFTLIGVDCYSKVYFYTYVNDCILIYFMYVSIYIHIYIYIQVYFYH